MVSSFLLAFKGEDYLFPEIRMWWSLSSFGFFQTNIYGFYFQVIAGGNYDVDCFVTDPFDNVLYNERKKQYDSFSHTTAMEGVYKVCFSNEFSTFTHKVVYMDFRHGEEQPLLENMSRSTALTQVIFCIVC
uniref:Transmembrane p24 trafficking protein 3 n=1 Tax=Cyprinodon variegatus TaxID=28743 RepID=A0A3Q2FYC0_CYPVA